MAEDAEFVCKHCNSVFPFKCRLTEHMNEVHDKVLKYPCRIPGCDKVYAIRASRNKHEKRPHPASEGSVTVRKFECKFGCLRAGTNEVKWYTTKDLREQHHARMHSEYKKTLNPIQTSRRGLGRKPAARAVGVKAGESLLLAYGQDNSLNTSAVNPMNFKATTVKQLLGRATVIEAPLEPPPDPRIAQLVRKCQDCDLATGPETLSQLRKITKTKAADTAALDIFRRHLQTSSADQLDEFAQNAQPSLLNRHETAVQMQLASAWRADPLNERVGDLVNAAWAATPQSWDLPWKQQSPVPTSRLAQAQGTLERVAASSRNADANHSAPWMLRLIEADAVIAQVFTLKSFQEALPLIDPFSDTFEQVAPLLVRGVSAKTRETEQIVKPILRALQGEQPSTRVHLMAWLSSPLRWLPMLEELQDLPAGKLRAAALDFIDRDLHTLDLQPEQQARTLALLRCVRDRGSCEKLFAALVQSKPRT